MSGKHISKTKTLCPQGNGTADNFFNGADSADKQLLARFFFSKKTPCFDPARLTHFVHGKAANALKITASPPQNNVRKNAERDRFEFDRVGRNPIRLGGLSPPSCNACRAHCRKALRKQNTFEGLFSVYKHDIILNRLRIPFHENRLPQPIQPIALRQRERLLFFYRSGIIYRVIILTERVVPIT